jgi:hypothetical protein
MDWIMHLDTDELLYPGGAAEYSVRRLLADVPADVDMVIFPNYVSQKRCSALNTNATPSYMSAPCRKVVSNMMI